MSPSSTLVLIPARLGSTRLPNKPLADIGGRPMIVRVAEQARLADVGPVAVCTDAAEVRDAVEAAGFTAVMTRGDHPSGSDRIHEALGKLDPLGRVSTILNLQGDLPTVGPATLRAAAGLMDDPLVGVGTICVRCPVDEDFTKPSVVKLVGTEVSPGRVRAIYFTRAPAPYGAASYFHHVGIYIYRRPVLDAFIALPVSDLEALEKLEQLRLIEAGYRIDAAIVAELALGVDTAEDLAAVRGSLGGG